MLDTVIKGTGNSRSIKAAPATLPLTYDEFRAQFISSGIPIDLLGLNDAGLIQRGTDLNKASLLSDAAAANFGLGANGTPDQAFRQLRPVASGSYIGTGGGTNENNALSLTFPFVPRIVIISIGGDSNAGSVYGFNFFSPIGFNSSSYISQFFVTLIPDDSFTIGRFNNMGKLVGNTIYWYNDGPNSNLISGGQRGVTYHYTAFG